MYYYKYIVEYRQYKQQNYSELFIFMKIDVSG